MRNTDKQRGAALILVLLVVAIIVSVGAFSSQNLLNFSKSTNDLANRQQAHWYSMGVESTASNFLVQRLKEKNRSKIISDDDLPVIKVSLNDVEIEGRLKDLNACFNVNSLVKKESIKGQFTINQAGVDQYKNLLKVLSFDDFEIKGLLYSLVDWIDSDSFISDVYGAEDDYYSRKEYSYRAANQPISLVGEMNSIKNYSREVMEILLPYLCVLPLVGNTNININSIPKEKPELLIMLIGESLNINSAKNILLNRPEGGFLNLEEFWSYPDLENIQVSNLLRSQLKLNSNFYLLKTKVYSRGYPYYMESVLNLDNAGFVNILSRRLGVF